ncbi:tetratricopeptide repeat protein [Rhodocyclaceae bacterium SMB388]
MKATPLACDLITNRWKPAWLGGSVVTAFVVALMVLLPTQSVLAQQGEIVCPPLERKFGPHDYLDTSARRRFLNAVETHHFTDRVRSLNPRGQTGSLIGDVQYTLNWFPNHHEALDLLGRLAVRERNPQPLGASAHIECRFQWARQVSPRDEMVPMIQGLYYHRLGRHADAIPLFERAVELAPHNATVRYNFGLVLVQARRFEDAREQARAAYGMGFPLPGLRDQLRRSGYPLGD